MRIPQRPLFQALIECGARWGELTAITWADFDVERAVLRLRAPTTKTRRQRFIPVRRAFVAALVELRKRHAASRGRAACLNCAAAQLACWWTSLVELLQVDLIGRA